MIEALVEDNVVRATSACWVETVTKDCLDVSKYPRIAVVADEQRREVIFGVVAFKKIDSDDEFEVLFEHEDEHKVRAFYYDLILKLQSPLSLVH
jgi:hypothetical protein